MKLIALHQMYNSKLYLQFVAVTVRLTMLLKLNGLVNV